MLDNRVISLSESDLCDYLCWIVWRDKPYCPRCESNKIAKSSFKNYYCPDCKYHFSPRSMGPFKGTRFSLKKWILYAYLYLNDPKIRKCDFQKIAKVKHIQAVDRIFNQLPSFLSSDANKDFFNEVFSDFDKYLNYLNKIGKAIPYEHKVIYKKDAPLEYFNSCWLRGRILAKNKKKVSGRSHFIYFLIIQINGYKIKCMLNYDNWKSVSDIENEELLFFCDIVFTHKNIRVLIKNNKKIPNNNKIIDNNDEFFALCKHFNIDLNKE